MAPARHTPAEGVRLVVEEVEPVAVLALLVDDHDLPPRSLGLAADAAGVQSRHGRRWRCLRRRWGLGRWMVLVLPAAAAADGGCWVGGRETGSARTFGR